MREKEIRSKLTCQHVFGNSDLISASYYQFPSARRSPTYPPPLRSSGSSQPRLFIPSPPNQLIDHFHLARNKRNNSISQIPFPIPSLPRFLPNYTTIVLFMQFHSLSHLPTSHSPFPSRITAHKGAKEKKAYKYRPCVARGSASSVPSLF